MKRVLFISSKYPSKHQVCDLEHTVGDVISSSVCNFKVYSTYQIKYLLDDADIVVISDLSLISISDDDNVLPKTIINNIIKMGKQVLTPKIKYKTVSCNIQSENQDPPVLKIHCGWNLVKNDLTVEEF